MYRERQHLWHGLRAREPGECVSQVVRMSESSTFTVGVYTAGGSDLTYSLMVEVLDLLPEDEILEKSWTSLTGSQTVLVADLSADIVTEKTGAIIDDGTRDRCLGSLSCSGSEMGISEGTSSGGNKPLQCQDGNGGDTHTGHSDWRFVKT
jgi:hypothetical protein